MECILKGDISITDNYNFIIDIATAPQTTSVKIITMEDSPSLDGNLPNVINGSLLLPPIESLMAAANGDEGMFYAHYIDHLNTPVVDEFISLLIAALYRGTSLILFYPEDDLNLKGKILDMWYKRYGIMIGEISVRPCQYDNSAIPIWLQAIFRTGAISPFELLTLYPEEALIEDRLMYNLIAAIKPIGTSFNEKVKYIISLRHKLKENPNLIVPFEQY